MVAAPIKIKRIGIIKDYRPPKWVKEGYCEYIARDSSFPEKKGIQLLVERKQNNSISFKSFVWRKMVEYLIDMKGYSFNQLIYNRLNQDEVKKEIIEWAFTEKYCQKLIIYKIKRQITAIWRRKNNGTIAVCRNDGLLTPVI